jgi:hypothetical protein
MSIHSQYIIAHPKKKKRSFHKAASLIYYKDRFVLMEPYLFLLLVQWNLDLRKPDLRKNLDLRKIVGTTDFLVHKLFDLRKIF